MSQADAAGGCASIPVRQGSPFDMEAAKKPLLPLRPVDREEALDALAAGGGPEDAGGPALRRDKKDSSAVETAVETLLRSLAEEPFETVFEDPSSTAPNLTNSCQLRNLDTGEVRPFAMDNLTQSFVGFPSEPSRLRKSKHWRQWWHRAQLLDERLLQAAAEGNIRIIHELTHPSDGGPPAAVHSHCKSGASSGRGPLHLAVASGVVEAVEALLSQGADVNFCSRKTHLTPLHVASANGNSEMVELLLEARADAMSKTEDRQLALHYAAANAHTEVVKILLQHERDSRDQGHEGHGQVGVRNASGQRPVEAASDLQTLCIFRDFEAEGRFLGGLGLGCKTSMTSSRRNSASSEASTATGSSWSCGEATDVPGPGPLLPRASSSEGPAKVCADGYDRTPLANGFLLRNARTDAVRRLMQLTRELDEAQSEDRERDGRTLSAKSFKAASPKDSPGRSPSASSGTSTPKIRTPFARMRQGSSRVEKVGPNSFELVNLLGRGSFGEVFQVKHKRTGKAYAMKVLQKSRIMSSNLLRYAVTERNILAYIHHPYIVSLHYAFQTPSHLVLVLQYCPRGNLQHLITREKRLCEDLSRVYTAEILLALIHLHERHTVFRDLKPDNVVIDEAHHALLTDFGLSKEGVGQRGTKSFCGSVAFLAPEILLRKGHNHTVDIYNLGVLLYDMLTGLPPFYHHDRETLFTNIKHAPLEVPLYVSRIGRSFIEATMDREPAKRIGAHHTSDVKGHVFFAEVDFAQLMRREVLPPEAHPLDEPASWNRNGPLGLAGRTPESPFARAERGWRGRYARGQNGERLGLLFCAADALLGFRAAVQRMFRVLDSFAVAPVQAILHLVKGAGTSRLRSSTLFRSRKIFQCTPPEGVALAVVLGTARARLLVTRSWSGQWRKNSRASAWDLESYPSFVVVIGDRAGVDCGCEEASSHHVSPHSHRSTSGKLLADLLSRSGFDAIVEMAEEADAISEWLPHRFRTEMRISVSDLPAVELLKLVRSATGVPNLDVDADIMDVIENGCEDVRHTQRLFAEVGLGGKKVWILMESMADAEEDLFGRHHELLLKVSAGALDRRVERLQQLMNGWTQSQIQEGLSLHLTTAAEALAWCQNRLDDIHEEYPPRSGTPGISDGDWQLQLRDTAFSPKGKSWRRKKKPGLQFFPLRPSAHRFSTPSKDEGKHFWQRPEMRPTPRLDMVVRRQDVRACDVGSRVLEAKSQERETVSRCRWAEYQAERRRVTPVSKQPRFTRQVWNSGSAMIGCPGRSRQAAWRRVGSDEASDKPCSLAEPCSLWIQASFACAKRPGSSTQRGGPAFCSRGSICLRLFTVECILLRCCSAGRKRGALEDGLTQLKSAVESS
ncbi:pkgB [Symbiodinium sp. CCMP2456]|nr:pkgB [Symbiodinium sp. CCMP2456]